MSFSDYYNMAHAFEPVFTQPELQVEMEEILFAVMLRWALQSKSSFRILIFSSKNILHSEEDKMSLNLKLEDQALKFFDLLKKNYSFEWM